MEILTRYQLRMADPQKDAVVIARLKVACWREAYEGILPAALLDELSVERATRSWEQALGKGVAWIAEYAGTPVGFTHVTGGEVTTLYVRKSDQGCGLGCELLQRSFEEIACLAYEEARVWVLEENTAARHFYERMGGQRVARRAVGFSRWPDIMEVRYDFHLPD
tara:strand:- start:59255 stop:59749 length:495 start_codon:yes stop_codon:yes gene_type:complete